MENVSSVASSFLQAHDYIGLSQAPSSSSSSSSSSCTVEADAECDTLDLGLGLGLGSRTANEVKPVLMNKQPDSKMSSSSAGLKRSHSELSMTEAKFQETKNQQFLSNWAAPKAAIPAWMEKTPVKANVVGSEDSKTNDSSSDISQEPDFDDSPPSKDRIVGWPPVRTYRRQTLAKPAEMFVKVNMDGITVGRKVDLNAYTSYEALSLALEEMFQPSYAAQGIVRTDVKHFLLSSGSEFVLTYEDKDGDWMLVGDVPWSMFVSSVKRLRISRGSEVNSSVPRMTENSRFHV